MMLKYVQKENISVLKCCKEKCIIRCNEHLFLIHANKTRYTAGTEVVIGVLLSGETEALPSISSSF